MKKAVEKIRQAVGVEAEAEAARMRANAREEIEGLLADARGEEERKALASLSEERARLAQEKFRDISRARRAMRLSLLAARNRVIEEIFSLARAEILSIPPGRYREILRKWLAEIDAPEGGEILPAPRDAGPIGELVAEMNRSRPPAAMLVLSKARAPFESGFIVRTPRFEIERSIEGWLDDRKRELAPRFEREFFGDVLDAHAE